MKHIPRKRFGQHFLIDQTIIHRIVDKLSPQINDLLVEIGPGQGALTTSLLPLVSTLNVVELDRDVIPHLQKNCNHSSKLIVHEADALSFDFKSLGNPLRLVGNLPYNISTPLLFHLFEAADNIQDMLFMLQKEVCDRLTAAPNSKQYGRLSVMAQYHAKITACFDVPPEAFNPPPKVESGVIQLIPHPVFPHCARDYSAFRELVKQAFNYRRKTLSNCLKGIVEPRHFDAANIDPKRRPETLSLAEFVTLSNTVSR